MCFVVGLGWVGSNRGRKDKIEERREKCKGLICQVDGRIAINDHFNTV